MKIINIIANGAFAIFFIGGEIFSIPLGIWYSLQNGSLFNLLCSIFVPFYGFVYAIINWLS